MGVDQRRKKCRVLALAPDNFTPQTRTPWGGTRLAELKGIARQVVGESWEVSVEPDFPSRVIDGESLAEVIQDDPLHWLGFDFGHGNTSLLVKLLDTDDELSVQIHPSDDYSALAENESGKPESWYVVAREEGAGIYLGWRAGVALADVRRVLEEEGDLSQLLSFVPVEVGDFFVIDAGTPHAIGRGLTLVEPQRVLPKKRGLTYRYWDWNRRYNDQGVRDASGSPRALHVDDALAVTSFPEARGDAFLRLVRTRAGGPNFDGPVRHTPLSGPGAPLDFRPLSVARIDGEGELELPLADHLRALTVLAGTVQIDGIRCGPGHSMVLAARGGAFVAQCSQAHAIVSAAHA